MNNGSRGFILFAMIGFFAVPLLAQDGHMKMMDKKHWTMENILTADTLYTCDHHPWMITDNPDAHCTASGCDMAVRELSEEELEHLRSDDHLRTCMMASCSVVVTSDSELTSCPVCGMALKELGQPKSHGKMMHH